MQTAFYYEQLLALAQKWLDSRYPREDSALSRFDYRVVSTVEIQVSTLHRATYTRRSVTNVLDRVLAEIQTDHTLKVFRQAQPSTARIFQPADIMTSIFRLCNAWPNLLLKIV